MGLPPHLAAHLSLPLIAAPMTAVSGPELVIAACRNGVIGSFPTHNARTAAELDRWMNRITVALDDAGESAAPVAPNLVVHRTNPRLMDDVACLVRHGTKVVITSVGSPEPVVGALHEAGCMVLSDVATMRHVDRALAVGADGLVLLAAGAGGQTGWNNPFAFVRAVRERFDGPLVLAGGISDGQALLSAQVLGADLAYMGTRFIATRQSMASPAYQAALVEASLDEVTQTTAHSGLPANFLTSWLDGAERRSGGQPMTQIAGFSHDLVADLPDVWAAGHSVHAVHDVVDVADLIESTRIEFEMAKEALRQFGWGPGCRTSLHEEP